MKGDFSDQVLLLRAQVLAWGHRFEGFGICGARFSDFVVLYFYDFWVFGFCVLSSGVWGFVSENGSVPVSVCAGRGPGGGTHQVCAQQGRNGHREGEELTTILHMLLLKFRVFFGGGGGKFVLM